MNQTPRSQGDPPTLDDADQEDYDRQDQEDVDESPQRVGCDQAESPQNEQDRKNCPQHLNLLSRSTETNRTYSAERYFEWKLFRRSNASCHGYPTQRRSTFAGTARREGRLHPEPSLAEGRSHPYLTASNGIVGLGRAVVCSVLNVFRMPRFSSVPLEMFPSCGGVPARMVLIKESDEGALTCYALADYLYHSVQNGAEAYRSI